MGGRRPIIGFVSALVFLATGACGGAGAPPTSGVDLDQDVKSLDDVERATLCDWGNGLLGGYGKTITCSDGRTPSGDDTQAECLERLTYFDGCTFSVRDYETCWKYRVEKICDRDRPPTPECEAFTDCVAS